jgi:hypothetical protein
VLRDGTVSAFFTDRGVALSLLDPKANRGWGVHWLPLDLARAEPRAAGEALGAAHFLVGAPPEWRTSVPGCSEIVYDGVRPGVSLVFESRPRGVEYRFHAAPGADVSSLRFRYEGALALRVVDDGAALEIETGAGLLREHGLRCTQPDASGPREVPSRYVQTGPLEYAIALGSVDPRLPLDIDPVIDWTFVINPNSLVSAHALAVDAAGFVYLTGATSSTDYPCTGGFDCTWDGMGDAYVTKLDPTGTSIVWSTYLGSTGNEAGQGIAVDGAGNVYVAGSTSSTNFPGAASGFQTTLNGTSPDAFLAKLAASGASVLWSTYLGGTGIEDTWGLKLDGSGHAVLCGMTWSSDFPISGGFDATFQSQTEAFVARIDVSGSAPVLDWSSFLGGSGNEEALALDVDASGNIYVTGDTSSTDFPVPNGFDTAKDGTWDVFVTKILPDGTGIVWSTFLGGGSVPGAFELAEGIAVDASGNVFVAGRTNADTFPTTGGFQTTYGGNEDAFVAKISATGSALLWSTYLGGTDEEEAHVVAVDTAGNAYVAGFTRSPDFPTLDPFDAALDGAYDVFLTRVNADGTLAWSSYLGGPAGDNVWAMTATEPDTVYVAVTENDLTITRFRPPSAASGGGSGGSGSCGLLGAELLLLLALRRRSPR